jgi:hypothetical protein
MQQSRDEQVNGRFIAFGEQPKQPLKGKLVESRPIRYSDKDRVEFIWSHSYQTLSFILAAVGLIVASAYTGKLERGERWLPLVVASFFTCGEYAMVQNLARRVWRAVVYLRLRTEPRLAFTIAWETAAHQRIEKESYDRAIFKSHLWILTLVNVPLALGIIVDLLPDCLWNHDRDGRSLRIVVPQPLTNNPGNGLS